MTMHACIRGCDRIIQSRHVACELGVHLRLRRHYLSSSTCINLRSIQIRGNQRSSPRQNFGLTIFFYVFKPSIDQPVNGSCCISAIEKVNWDNAFLTRVNASRLSIGLPAASKLDSTKLRIILALRSCAFVVGDKSRVLKEYGVIVQNHHV